jgi:hypothetical protein
MSFEIDKVCMDFLGFRVIRCLISINKVYLGVLWSLAELPGTTEADMSFCWE